MCKSSSKTKTKTTEVREIKLLSLLFIWLLNNYRVPYHKWKFNLGYY